MPDSGQPPAFSAAELVASFDQAAPQHAYLELSEQAAASRPDSGMPVFARREDVAALTRHPDVRSTDGRHFDLGGERPLIPLNLDGEEHRRFRRLLDPLFTPRAVERLVPVVRERVDELIDQFIGEGQAELFSALCVPLPSELFISLLGLPREDLPVFLTFKESVIRPQGETEEEQAEFARQAGVPMYEYLNAVLDERSKRDEPGDDLIGGFLTTEIGGERLTRENIIDICYLLVIAGLDTVTSSLSCILAWFAIHPQERRRITADPALIPLAVEELMRYESPVPLGHRWVSKDIEVNGRHIPAGTRVQVLWAAANVDPDAFAEPLSVDLGRQRNAHVAFATGPHRCLGAHLARMELRTAVEEFHRRIPEYWITPGADVTYINFGVRAALSLPISFEAARGKTGR
jgi:cytochrome P450